MKDIENIQKRLGITRTAAILTSLIAIGAVILANYALDQKKEATAQARLAQQRAEELVREQRIALEQRINADSTKEQAAQQKQAALENELDVAKEKVIADSQTRRAEKNALMVLTQQIESQRLKQIADQQTAKADSNAQVARKQQELVEKERSHSSELTQKSDELKQLSYSRTMANESILLLNENRFDSSKIKALQAYQLNKNNNGPAQNSDIYDALNRNWTKSINNKNQFGIHKLPVHCITGMPHTNIIFTADESGTLYESEIKNSSLQKIASYSDIKEEVRALSVSPDGNKLVAITSSGNGFVFAVSRSDIVMKSNFKFSGIGKAVAFNSVENFIVVSSEGISKYKVENVKDEISLDDEGINTFTIGKSGKIYIASGNQVKVYKNWDDLMHHTSPGTINFDFRVTSVAVEDNEQFMAAGTYNGFIRIIDLKTNNGIWKKRLHSSSVNDIKFATVDNDKIQLASAGADQTVKLVDVKAILQKNDEDIITLKGHTRWIYALYYTPDGLWLFSTSEDNKVIAWKPTMTDLYQTLCNIK